MKWAVCRTRATADPSTHHPKAEDFACGPFAQDDSELVLHTLEVSTNLETETVFHLRRNHSWIVEVKSADRDAVVLENAVIGDIHCTD